MMTKRLTSCKLQPCWDPGIKSRIKPRAGTLRRQRRAHTAQTST